MAEIEPVQARNELARDAFSYLHLPLVAAIVLVALGMKSTLAHVDDPLPWETAGALAGGAALYLASLVAFQWRCLGIFSARRFVTALVLLALVPLARQVDALVMISLVAVVFWALLASEARHDAEARNRIRHAEVP